MKQFELLQKQIQELHPDYDKDEATLLAEVNFLEEKNRQSLKNQRNIKKQADDTQEALTKIVEKLNEL